MTGNRMRVWFALFVAFVFIAGVATGVVLGPRLVGPLDRWGWELALGGRLRPAPGPPRGMGPGVMMPAPLVSRLADELKLDAAQRQKLQAVFERRRERLASVNRELRERFEAEQTELRREVSEILTPDQQRRFEAWLSSRAPRRSPRRPEPPPR
jgi:Spy/CpxP family protein refolding chaperone